MLPSDRAAGATSTHTPRLVWQKPHCHGPPRLLTGQARNRCQSSTKATPRNTEAMVTSTLARRRTSPAHQGLLPSCHNGLLYVPLIGQARSRGHT